MLNQLLKCLFIFVISFYEQTAFSDVNNTFPISSPSIDYGSADSFKMDNSGGDSGSNYYDFPKNPPYCRSDFSELYNSFWLIPALSYLMTINRDSLQLQQNPVASLVPVALATASHGWFHEQQVIDLMHDRDVKVVGDPVFVAEMADGGDGDKTSKTSSPASNNGQHDSSQQGTPSNPSASASSSESNGQDDEEDDDEDDDEDVIHLCGKPACPACNHKPCHCPNCLVVIKPTEKDQRAESDTESSIGNKRKSGTSKDAPLKKRLRPRKTHKTTSHVQTKNNPALALPALKLRESLTPELVLSGHPLDEYPYIRESFREIQAVIPMENGNLLSWTHSDIKIWSFQDGTYISDSVPVAPQKIIKVFIIKNNHIVVWFNHCLLQHWKKVDGVWRSNDIHRSTTHAVQLSNQQLVIITKPHREMGILEEDAQSFIFTKIHEFDCLSDSARLMAVSETQFITFIENRDYGIVNMWEEQDGRWVSREYYKSIQRVDRLFKLLDDQTILILEMVHGYGNSTKVWSQHNGKRSHLPLPDLFESYRSGFLSDGRVYTFGTHINYHNRNIPHQSLVLLAEAEDEWKTSVVFTNPTTMDCHYDALSLLNDGRIVVATTLFGKESDDPHRIFSFEEKLQIEYEETIPLERKIQLFLEEQGKWSSVLLGNIDSSVIGMTKQGENKLITWHEDGSIQIWNL